MLHYIDTSLSHIINDNPLVIFPIQSVLKWINYGIYTEIYKVLPTVVYNAFIKRELNQKYRLEAIVFTFSLKQTHSMISVISLNNDFKNYIKNGKKEISFLYSSWILLHEKKYLLSNIKQGNFLIKLKNKPR